MIARHLVLVELWNGDSQSTTRLRCPLQRGLDSNQPDRRSILCDRCSQSEHVVIWPVQADGVHIRVILGVPAKTKLAPVLYSESPHFTDATMHNWTTAETLI